MTTGYGGLQEGLHGDYQGLQRVIVGNKGLEAPTQSCKRLQNVIRGYRGFQGLQGVTDGYKGLQWGTRGYRGLQGVTGCYRGLQ